MKERRDLEESLVNAHCSKGFKSLLQESVESRC
jgi:hypothetical protein